MVTNQWDGILYPKTRTKLGAWPGQAEETQFNLFPFQKQDIRTQMFHHCNKIEGFGKFQIKKKEKNSINSIGRSRL